MNAAPIPDFSPTLSLFAYDWSALGFERQRQRWGCAIDHAGFDLHAFPANWALPWFDFERFVDRLVAQARRKGWRAVVSTHEQFGALAAALLAERMGWPGTPVHAVLACQHKLHARNVMQAVIPEANLRYQMLEASYGQDIPQGVHYPVFVKPVKAAFSVLARTVHGREQLRRHTRFSLWERWVIERLVEPFERMARRRLGVQASAHGLILEEPIQAPQYNLDGYVFRGEVRAVGWVDAVMYPGTHAFMRFELPSRLPLAIQQRALEVARRFLAAVGFDHGQFNMEFFHDPVTDRLTVIEFNPRMASQFSDLYLRVLGLDLHAVALALAHDRDPATLPLLTPVGNVAASLVYRVFRRGDAPPRLGPSQRAAFRNACPDGLLFEYPKPWRAQARDLKWLGSYRYGILHLHGRDHADLRHRCEQASGLLGWTPPYEPAATVVAQADTDWFNPVS
jgi:hypothetical protein